jgi:hypothetical protein
MSELILNSLLLLACSVLTLMAVFGLTRVQTPRRSAIQQCIIQAIIFIAGVSALLSDDPRGGPYVFIPRALGAVLVSVALVSIPRLIALLREAKSVKG